jgi:DNA-binding CsgD family transcriptional regulator/tetratricopeptide (TPR) repeat protein
LTLLTVSDAGADALLERERELATVEALVTAGAAGESGVACIEGSAGIGKSRLIAHARDRAVDEGFVVFSARGAVLEREFAFGAVRQLFEGSVARDPGLLDRGSAASAGRIFKPATDVAEAQSREDPSFAALHGLYWLTVHLCEEQPLMLAVDDLQWCDAPSLRYLAYLRNRLVGLPVLVVVGLRSDEPAGHGGLIEAIVGDPSTSAIRPAPLSEVADAALVRRRLGADAEDDFCVACHRATGGNPLLTTELLKVLAAEGVRPTREHVLLIGELGPRSMSRAIFLRLSRLPAEATSVARGVAILGDHADPATIAKLAGLDETQAANGIAALARAEILHPQPPVRFVHPLVAAAVYRDVLVGERELAHRRAAELLWRAAAPAQAVASHLLLAPARGEPWAVHVLADGAAWASAAGAPESAAAYLTRALAEDPGGDRESELVLALGQVEALTSGAAAAEHLRRAYQLLSDPQERASAAQVLARTLLFTSSPDDAAEVARRAAAELPLELSDLRDALEAFEMFCVLFGAGDRRSLERLERHHTRRVGPGVGAKMLAAIAAQAWMYACGPSDAISALSLAALAGGELIAADNGLLANCPITNLTFADRPEALEWWEVAREDAHRRGSLFAISSINLWCGHTLYRRGELVEAEESLSACRVELDQWGHLELEAQIYCDAHLAAVLRERGDLSGARRALERSRDPGGADDGARYWLNSAIELLLAERRFDEALKAADEYARRFDDLVVNPMDAPWRSHKAYALNALGCRDEAHELVVAELELARAWGAPGTISRSLRALGTLSRERGLEHLEEAVSLTAGTPARLEHAKALVALGTGLRHQRRLTAARDPLRSALEIAVVSGAERLAEQIRSELYASGARPRGVTLTGVGSLTATERRVARLAADGATNREAAEALFVTPKTVEMHLHNVYRKLGITSRRALPSAMAQ